MSITTANIAHIENYLKSNGVIFDDLRIELVDHISSAVEFEMAKQNLGFHQTFSKYVIENKSEFLNPNEPNNKWNFMLALKTFFKFLINKNVIIVALLLFIVFQRNYFELIKEYSSSIQLYAVIALIVFSLGWIAFFNGIFKKRFFALENNFNVMIIFFGIFNLARVLTVPQSVLAVNLTLIYGIITVLFIWFIGNTTYKYYNKNKQLYTA
ncbi:hypothetical protein FLAN108750_11675 [Flavobacterium antarcticum]|uniref:hypothetical protein n=1 Tax=Flavobacterium antarcticum TaxID=271155 RepID=UPI0003B534D5|nr:hypothetical protein [Flavobacterium antarcticum]